MNDSHIPRGGIEDLQFPPATIAQPADHPVGPTPQAHAVLDDVRPAATGHFFGGATHERLTTGNRRENSERLH